MRSNWAGISAFKSRSCNRVVNVSKSDVESIQKLLNYQGGVVKSLGRMLTDPTHENYRVWQSIVTLFIFVSCVALAVETVPEIAEKYSAELFILEWISVGIFTADYLANLLYSEEKLSYAFSVWGIIDLVSILPSYLMLLNLTALQGTKVLRLVRVARVLRVLKLVRVAVGETSGAQNPIMANQIGRAHV